MVAVLGVAVEEVKWNCISTDTGCCYFQAMPLMPVLASLGTSWYLSTNESHKFCRLAVLWGRTTLQTPETPISCATP